MFSQNEWNRAHRATMRISERKWRANNPFHARFKTLNFRAKRLGHAPIASTLEEAQQWYERQNLTECHMCRRPISGRHAVIDHCHKTGRLRGILCMRCNTALGVIENGDLVALAEIYLAKRGDAC